MLIPKQSSLNSCNRSKGKYWYWFTYTNVNDGTVEGFENKALKLTTVQFHPEAYGGPRDTEAHFFDALYRRIA